MKKVDKPRAPVSSWTGHNTLLTDWSTHCNTSGCLIRRESRPIREVYFLLPNLSWYVPYLSCFVLICFALTWCVVITVDNRLVACHIRSLQMSYRILSRYRYRYRCSLTGETRLLHARSRQRRMNPGRHRSSTRDEHLLPLQAAREKG